MNTIRNSFYSLIFFAFSFLYSGCCDCYENQVYFSPEIKTWAVAGQIGDTVAFEDSQGNRRNFRVDRNGYYADNFGNQNYGYGGFCDCPDNEYIYYQFVMTGDNQVQSAPDGIKSMTWRFDSYTDHEGVYFDINNGEIYFQSVSNWMSSFTVNNVLYKDVHFRSYSRSDVTAVYFAKSVGLIRFDTPTNIWERVN